jgi:hypothetical protein
MAMLEFKKHKDNYEINLYEGKNSKSHYTNIINKNPKQLAQILIDLHLDGYKVDEAIKIFLSRIKNKDWLGF